MTPELLELLLEVSFNAWVDCRRSINPKVPMSVGATACLPLITEPIVNNVELVLKDFINKQLHTTVEVISDDCWIVTHKIASKPYS